MTAGEDGAPGWRPVLALLVVAGIVYALGQAIVAPAMPALQDAYDSGPEATSWVFTSFLLATCVSTPLAGRLGDLFGRSRVLGVLLLLFGLGSVVSGSADSLGQLIGGRVLQGLGGGVLPLSVSVVRDVFPASKVPLGVGALGASWGVGAAMAFPLSGLVVEGLGVSGLFWIGIAAVPVGVAAMIVIPSRGAGDRVRIDWAGAFVLAVALLLTLLGVTQGNAWGWDSRVLALIAAGLLLLGAWVALELRVPVPLVSVRGLAERRVLLVNASSGLMGFAMLGTLLLIPQLAQVPDEAGFGTGLSLTGTGLVLLPGTLCSIGFALSSGALYRRLGGRGLGILGYSTMLVGITSIAVVHDSPSALIAGHVVYHAGITLGLASTNNLLLDAAPAGDVGVHAAINAVTRYGVGSVGTAVLMTILASDEVLVGGALVPSEAVFHLAFAVAGAAVALGLVAILLLRPVDAEPHDVATADGRADGAAEPAAASAQALSTTTTKERADGVTAAS